jgi:hypothetical protein
VESGPFTTLEQVMLASTGAAPATVVRGFGAYNAVATLGGAAGALRRWSHRPSGPLPLR